MTHVYPSILSCDFGRLREEALAAQNADADGLHVDVMDGVFVPNITIGPTVVKALKGHVKIPIDCHLMIVNPDPYLKDFATAGATSITVHAEVCKDLPKTLASIRGLGCKAGVSINPATRYESLLPLLDHIDLILCMTVNPGFGGQALIPEALEKAGRLVQEVKRRSSRKILIEVDGGINIQTAPRARELGVDILVAGSAVFGAKNYADAIEELRGETGP